MAKHLHRLASLGLLAGLLASALGSDMRTGLTPSASFSASVDGIPQFVYQATADGSGMGRGTGINSSFVYVSLTPLKSLARANRRLEIRPTSQFKEAHLRPRGSPALLVNGSSIIIDIDQPGHYMLELDGRYDFVTLATGLMIFVDIQDAPTSQPDVYFGPGLHELPYDPEFGGRLLRLKNDSTVYLDEAAVVLGYIRGEGVHNVSIRGRGILAASFWPGQSVPTDQKAGGNCGFYGKKAIEISNSSGVVLDGITIVHATSWDVRVMSSLDVHIRGLKVIAWQCMNDGIDVVSSQNVVIEQCFIRSNDDAIAIKGQDPTMDTKDVLVQDNLLWGQSIGNCMEIGFELWNGVVSNITFTRNVCLHSDRAAMSIHNAGHAAVHGITYRDIVIEGVLPNKINSNEAQGLQLIDMTIPAGKYSGPDATRRGSITDITFSNISYHPNKVSYLFSRLLGNSSAHMISNISFDNFQIGDVSASSLADFNATSAFLDNVTFTSNHLNILFI